MSGWRYKRWLALSLLLAGLVWGVILLFSTKPPQLWLLRRTVGFEEIDFEEAQFSWGEAYIEDIELETAGIRLQARETRVTFSVWKALIGRRDAIADLRFSKARLRDMDPANRPWPGRILTTLEGWRPRKDLLRFESMSFEGVWERMNDTDVSLVVRTGPLDFSDQGKLEMQVEPSIENREDLSPKWLISGILSWSRPSGKLLVGAEGNATLFAENGIPVGSNQFSSGLSLSASGQSLEGEWMDGERTVCQIDLSRPSTDMPFAGLGDLAINQRDLGAFWMPFNLFRIETGTEISVQWNPENGTGACELQLDGNASSFLHRHIGLLRIELEANFSFDSKGIVAEGMLFNLSTGREESLAFSQAGELSFPSCKGNDANLSLEAKNLRLDWFRYLVPWNMDETWELSDLSLAAWSVDGFWELKADPIEVLQGGARMIGVTKLVGKLTEANSTSSLLELDVEGSVERDLLSKFLPKEGPLAVFDENDSLCSFAGAVAFSSEGVILKHGEAELANSEGVRGLHLRSVQELRLDRGQPYFLPPTQGDLFAIKGNNLPVDGLIRWESGGEVQGDAQLFSGKVSHNEKGWIFRSDKTVEIGNARIVRREMTFGEGLQVQANLEVVLDDKGRLRVDFDELLLKKEEKTSFAGSLELVAEPTGKGGFLARTVESSRLKVDLTTLPWLGFPEIFELENGFLEIGKFKALLSDEFSFELDGTLVDFQVVNEAPLNGGVQATVRRQPDGFSTWAQLSLVRENRESTVAIDVFIPSEDNASRRKLILSAEQIHADELLAFVSTIPAPKDLDALLKGELFPQWALGDWELTINELHLKGVPPFEEVKAKLALRSRELLLSYAKAKWLSGFVSVNGSLSLGQSDDPGIRLQKFAAKADQVEIRSLTSRFAGLADARLNGWSEGSDWGEALRMFSGEIALTAKDGSLHLGPLGRANAEGNLPKTPWSLTRLGELLEGKVSVSELHEILLGKMDSALEEIQYDLFQMVAQRAADGNFTVTELSVRGPSFQMDGNGKVTSFLEGEEGGALNLNLSFGARAELGKTLQGLGILAPIKAEGEYRMLKKDPMVVQGTLGKPDFSNFWALLAEGIGLGGFDLPEPE